MNKNCEETKIDLEETIVWSEILSEQQLRERLEIAEAPLMQKLAGATTTVEALAVYHEGLPYETKYYEPSESSWFVAEALGKALKLATTTDDVWAVFHVAPRYSVIVAEALGKIEAFFQKKI